MKTCVIRQPAGLGDILFTYKVAKRIIDTQKADIVYWPVSWYYKYLQEYIGTDKIIFIDENTEFPFKDVYLKDPYNIINNDELLYIPLQRADSIVPYKDNNYPMYCKYELVGLPYNDWLEFVSIKRDRKRETNLEQHIHKPINFSLINKTFGTYPGQQTVSAIPQKENSIEIKDYIFDRPFDWLGLMEQAQEIHTVETSFCYLLSFLRLKNVTVYARNTKTNFNYVRCIFPKEWNYIC